MLTFRLSKIRFWNYIANKIQWTKKSRYKKFKLETENILSKSLHEKLTRASL